MRLSEGDELDDALELFHNHSWVEHKPQISAVQMAELIPVLAPLFQRSRPRVRQDKPKQMVANRPKAKVDRGSESRGRRLVGVRSGGLCEIEVDGVCTGRATDWCHRHARSQGGTWSPQNGLHGCHECHMWTHAHPSKARVNGWVCKSYDPIDTGVLRRGVWVVLDEEGGFELCPRKVA